MLNNRYPTTIALRLFCSVIVALLAFGAYEYFGNPGILAVYAVASVAAIVYNRALRLSYSPMWIMSWLFAGLIAGAVAALGYLANRDHLRDFAALAALFIALAWLDSTRYALRRMIS